MRDSAVASSTPGSRTPDDVRDVLPCAGFYHSAGRQAANGRPVGRPFVLARGRAHLVRPVTGSTAVRRTGVDLVRPPCPHGSGRAMHVRSVRVYVAGVGLEGRRIVTFWTGIRSRRPHCVLVVPARVLVLEPSKSVRSCRRSAVVVRNQAVAEETGRPVDAPLFQIRFHASSTGVRIVRAVLLERDEVGAVLVV